VAWHQYSSAPLLQYSSQMPEVLCEGVQLHAQGQGSVTWWQAGWKGACGGSKQDGGESGVHRMQSREKVLELQSSSILSNSFEGQ